MYARVLFSSFIVLITVSTATAQNRFRWRPGSIVGGIADRIGSAVRERSDRQPDPELTQAQPIIDADGRIHDPTQHHGSTQYRHSTHHHHSPAQRVTPAQRFTPAQRAMPGHPPQDSRPRVEAVSVEQVIELVHRGLPESTVMQHIADNGLNRTLKVDDLIHLHEQGVSEPIINVMQAARVVDQTRTLERQPVSTRVADPPVRPPLGTLPPPPPRAEMHKFGPSILSP